MVVLSASEYAASLCLSLITVPNRVSRCYTTTSLGYPRPALLLAGSLSVFGTKAAVYKEAVLTSLLYGCES